MKQGQLKLVAIATLLCWVLQFTDGHLAVMSVDLGSEYMKIALVKPGVPMEVITNDDSARKTASIVGMRNGERFFGNAAENLATRFPSKAFWYLTQIIGKKFEDPQVKKYQERFPFYNLVKDEKRGTVLFQIDEETQYSPEELLAMQLEKTKEFAEKFADQPIRDAVITIPSYFNQAERRAVAYAAELGGMNLLQLLGDNAAVALNYGVFRRKQFTEKMQYYMFYDMGATSTTATIVGYQVVKTKVGDRLESNPQLTIKGVGYDMALGGLEISMRLRDHLAAHFNANKKTKKDLYSNDRAMAKLLKEAKRVKKVLSANADHMAQIEGLLDEEDFKLKVARSSLEEMCKDVFDRVTKPIEDAMKASEITLIELTDVILMGGGTRIPIVQEKLLKFLGRTELGKSINTDEAAAMGAVYQAAHLGKGFKVQPFGIKEANVFPITVEFEKQKVEDSVDPPRVIRRTLFGRMNPYPQKKVMTFNKHFKDFDFNVTYGDLTFMTDEEAETFRKLQGVIHKIHLKGVEEAQAKHLDKAESKGIKAHFRMDESGILTLETVESVFEKEQAEEKEESTWSKLGDTISGLFGSAKETDTKIENATDTAEGEKTASSEKPDQTGSEQKKADGGGSDQTEPDKTGSEQPASKETTDKDSKPSEEVGAEDEPKADDKEEKSSDEKKEEKIDEGKKEPEQEKAESEKTEKDAGDKKSEKEEKTEKSKDKDKKEEEAEKKPKIVVVKENITVEANVWDIIPPSKAAYKESKKRLSDLTARDKEKVLLEKAKNELEAFTYEMGDKLSQDLYEKCSTEEEREKISQKLAEASDWLYEQEEDAKKEVFKDKLKSLKKEVKDLQFRVDEAKERPQALEALTSMLNHSQYFLLGVKNLTQLEEEAIFTKVEVETLEKLINETEAWQKEMVAAQEKLPDYEKPKLLVEDIASKLQALDREVKYLITKAKTFKPKTKPKSSKNKTEDKNETKIETDSIPANETKDAEDSDATAESTTSKEGLETELPAPPTEESEAEAKEEEVLQLGDGKEEEEAATTTTTTEKPAETNTHDASDL